jgi:2-haloacid dehalogenase
MQGIKALTFDTGGTILDWHAGISAKLAEVGARRGIAADWAALTNAYRRKSLMQMTGGAPDFQPDFNIDDVHREQIERLAHEHNLAFTPADFDEIRDAWHTLACWPDVPGGLARLREQHTVASLTILSFRLILDTCKPAGIVWDAVFSCEAIGFYKMRPQAYQQAARWLQLEPSEIMMVAAHPVDLMSAQKVGFRAAMIRRPLEWGAGAAPPKAPDDFKPDIEVDDFNALADALAAARA